jgi:hypothetical protein
LAFILKSENSSNPKIWFLVGGAYLTEEQGFICFWAGGGYAERFGFGEFPHTTPPIPTIQMEKIDGFECIPRSMNERV